MQSKNRPARRKMVTIMNENNLCASKAQNNTAPSKAFVFYEHEQVCFADSGENNNFRITGYSGGIIKDHWLWGNIAFDLTGLKFAKKRTPVLEEHFTSSRIGFSTKQEITDKVTVEGEFLDNANAQALKGDIKKGFPMEASLYVPATVVEYVKEGASVEVNGQTLKGPGAVFRKATIKEVSMCVFGVDSNTKSSAYADNNENNVTFNLIKEADIMAKETEQMTVEKFAELHPDIRKQVFDAGMAEGEKKERDLFKELRAACGDDKELVVTCFAEGKTAVEALKMRAEKAEKTSAELTSKMAKLSEKRIDPAKTEFSDTATEPGKGEKFDEKTATDDQLKKHFAESKDIQDEFKLGGVDAYVAFKRKEDEGRVHIAGVK